MINGLQIIGLIFGLAMLYTTRLYNKRKNISSKETIIWGAIWCGFIFLVLFPRTTDVLLNALGIYRALDLFMVAAFMITFGVLFKVYSITRESQNNVNKLVREIALKQLKK